ncbi:rhomboid family intramembrane serine protease [Paludibacter sp. 221]|uniref:rhomboid family intramembrane serine protease n=1 Tax=Paludibacter sp. 221 TaxID=2302939 RepID=UPI0013D25453|nr:rhomboid family intramembrane serine protease [Paludibacter sp. 221]NDV46428.1 rhomboid family intramembrane serine protease [Paludibacter sp. 221]
MVQYYSNENLPETNTEKKHFLYSLVIPFLLVLAIFLCFILEKGMGWDFHTAGVFPRKAGNIWGIFTMIFVHADWGHLFNNIISLFVLSSTLYYFYNSIATKVLLLSYVTSGMLLWIIGRENWHIGASGLIYALTFFLFVSGIIRKHIPLIAISLIVVFLYGNIVWHLLPWQPYDPVSWEGHLSGAVSGIILAIIFRKQGPQKPVKIWDDEEDDNEAIKAEKETNNTDITLNFYG